jgi:hypothetical protein
VIRTFDWEQCSKLHKADWTAWLKTNHRKPVTEAEYAEAYRTTRTTDTRPYKARRYASAKLRKSYRNLVENFGFFL